MSVFKDYWNKNYKEKERFSRLHTTEWNCYKPSRDCKNFDEELNENNILKNRTDNLVPKYRNIYVKIKEDTTTFKLEVTLPLYVTKVFLVSFQNDDDSDRKKKYIRCTVILRGDKCEWSIGKN